MSNLQYIHLHGLRDLRTCNRKSGRHTHPQTALILSLCSYTYTTHKKHNMQDWCSLDGGAALPQRHTVRQGGAPVIITFVINLEGDLESVENVRHVGGRHEIEDHPSVSVLRRLVEGGAKLLRVKLLSLRNNNKVSKDTQSTIDHTLDRYLTDQ